MLKERLLSRKRKRIESDAEITDGDNIDRWMTNEEQGMHNNKHIHTQLDRKFQ